MGRGTSNIIQVYDPAAGFSLVRECSLGAGRNLQDIAFDAAGEAYVSCYDQAVLLRVDVENEQVLQSIDTSSFADADGLPETAWMQILGDRLYVTCQKLDRDYYYSPSGPGALLVLDTVSEQWVDMDAAQAGVQPIALLGGNPSTRIELCRDEEFGTLLRVGCVGYYGLQDGGLEQVDPVGGASLGYLVTESELGGDITGFTGTGAGSVHVLVSDASFLTSVRRVNLVTGQVTVVDQGSGYVHADLAWDGGFQLYVADRTAGDAGLRVLDSVSGAELTAAVIPTGLPPFQIVLPWGGGFSPTPETVPAVGALHLGRPFPNPCNPAADLAVEGEPGGTVRVRVLDLRGRLVRNDSVLLDAAGKALYRFDGRDGAGCALASGVYRVAAQSTRGFAARSVTLMK